MVTTGCDVTVTGTCRCGSAGEPGVVWAGGPNGMMVRGRISAGWLRGWKSTQRKAWRLALTGSRKFVGGLQSTTAQECISLKSMLPFCEAVCSRCAISTNQLSQAQTSVNQDHNERVASTCYPSCKTSGHGRCFRRICVAGRAGQLPHKALERSQPTDRHRFRGEPPSWHTTQRASSHSARPRALACRGVGAGLGVGGAVHHCTA